MVDQQRQQEPGNERIDDVLLHPVFARAFVSAEHPEGSLHALGDALGRDCMVVRFVDGWNRLYEGTGTRNEDWYSWGAEVLAPFDGTVERVQLNPVTNRPGQHTGGRASIIVFRRDDGVRVMYGHVDQVAVQPGDAVHAGQRVATVGNNGTCWHPHVHVGAWQDEKPLQVRFDLRALGRLWAHDPSAYFGEST